MNESIGVPTRPTFEKACGLLQSVRNYDAVRKYLLHSCAWNIVPAVIVHKVRAQHNKSYIPVAHK
jgi:hypothetical protein